jgi:hypothetical protein
MLGQVVVFSRSIGCLRMEIRKADAAKRRRLRDRQNAVPEATVSLGSGTSSNSPTLHCSSNAEAL